jgi:CHAT domain-containing protein
LGLALKSVAASTLASLWSVDDEATAKLMQGFYEAWNGGMSKAQAL